MLEDKFVCTKNLTNGRTFGCESQDGPHPSVSSVQGCHNIGIIEHNTLALVCVVLVDAGIGGGEASVVLIYLVKAI